MRKVKRGDHVRVHYRKRFDDGSWASSERGGPVDLIVGDPHPRLPGLGLALVGLTPGEVADLRINPGKAYGAADPKKIRTLPRNRLPEEADAGIGDRVQILKKNGRKQSVRIVELHADRAVVDANHRWAGMSMDLHVELLEVLGGLGVGGSGETEGGDPVGAAGRDQERANGGQDAGE